MMAATSKLLFNRDCLLLMPFILHDGYQVAFNGADFPKVGLAQNNNKYIVPKEQRSSDQYLLDIDPKRKYRDIVSALLIIILCDCCYLTIQHGPFHKKRRVLRYRNSHHKGLIFIMGIHIAEKIFLSWNEIQRAAW